MSKYKSGVIEGATFESQENGDDREATVMTVVVEKGFPVSARSIVILEVDEFNQLQQRIEELEGKLRKTIPFTIKPPDQIVYIGDKEALEKIAALQQQIEEFKKALKSVVDFWFDLELSSDYVDAEEFYNAKALLEKENT